MKRLAALARYGSSDEDEALPPAKKKKLPSLPDSIRPKLPIDNPALHQGRIRTAPHVDGQYAAYVYLPLTLERTSPLCKLLMKVFAHAKNEVPPLHPIGLPADLKSDTRREESPVTLSPDSVELHISLTRPIYLRTHQHEYIKSSVKAIAKSHPPFSVSLAAFSELTNDERTRTFLTIEVGAGHNQLKSMSDELLPTLLSLKQKEFYAEPRFHASFAWALLHHCGPSPSPAGIEAPSPPSLSLCPIDGQVEAGATKGPADTFPTIARFPPTLVSSLNAAFGERLRARHVGTFDVRAVHVRIGKDVFKWGLSGTGP